MLDSLRLYGRYVGISIRGQMQYRASFVMQTLGHALVTGGEFVAVWALFQRFGTLRGWTLPEVALLYGLVTVSFSLAEMIGRGFDTFHRLILRGDFDRLLVRPRSTALQVAGTELWLRAGRLAQGAGVLIWALSHLDGLTLAHAALLAGAVAGGICLFLGLLIGQATLAFWTIESLEIVNTVTYGGIETGQYPLSIYRPWFRRFFTFVVPLATVTWFPGLALLGRPSPVPGAPWLGWVSPLVGVAFLLVMLRVWEVGVRHYQSTGS